MSEAIPKQARAVDPSILRRAVDLSRAFHQGNERQVDRLSTSLHPREVKEFAVAMALVNTALLAATSYPAASLFDRLDALASDLDRTFGEGGSSWPAAFRSGGAATN